MNYTVKLHERETMNFKWDSARPLVKRVFEETYELPKELVLEELEEMLDVPSKRFDGPKDLDYNLRTCLSEKEEDEFIERNNRLYDFWQKVKPRIEEWMALFAERQDSNFKHFTIDLDALNWCSHEWDTAELKDAAYIDVFVS